MTPIINKIRFALSWLALVFAVSHAVPLFAQVTGAALSGTITDASGAVLAAARVTIVNQSTEVTRESVTDKDGFYSAPNLLPGNYDITVTASGFATTSRTGVRLNVGGDQVIDVQMKVGQVSQKVEVTKEPLSFNSGPLRFQVLWTPGPFEICL